MSWFYFIASDKKLEEYCTGIHLQGNAIVIENEDRVLNIYREEAEGYPEQYTMLKHIVGIEIGKYEYVKKELLSYIKDAVGKCRQLEIWSIWMDDPDRDIQVRRFKGDELSEDDVKWIFDQEFFEHPQCLKMYKWCR